jgi:polysaccharide pyruvyl transferase WcaK-like protein
MLEPLGVLKGMDAIFSIGGDIYTLNPNSDFDLNFLKFGDVVLKRGIPYILWGASIGPFTENPKAEKACKKHLRGLSLITARESATINYLKSLEVSDNVISCADPAYVVAPEIKADPVLQEGIFTIGLNLSPLSARFTGQSNEEAINKQVKSIEWLIKEFDAQIVLIPHVVACSNEGDDDLRYLRKIKKLVATEYMDSLTLLDTDPGFVGVKMELIKCNLVIAARMHCAVNALAAHIPTILVSYSRKAEGMCHYVYGHCNWILTLDEFAEKDFLLEKVRYLKNQEPKVRDYLSKRIPEIQQKAYQPIRRLKEVLE